MQQVEIRREGPPEWRPIPGWPGYEVSDRGEVRSSLKVGFAAAPSVPRTLATFADGDGYRKVQLYGSSRRRCAKVAWLVLEAFVGPRPGRLDACHNDGIPSNDARGNLRWDTRKANLADRQRHGTMNTGERNGHAALTADQVRAIRASTGSQSAIAATLGINQTTVSKIKRGVRWAHVA